MDKTIAQKYFPSLKLASTKDIKQNQSEMDCAHHYIKAKNKSDQIPLKLKSQ